MSSLPDAPTPSADHAPATSAAPAGATSESDELGYDLLLYGNEQVTRGSDNGVLVAFAALAFQQIRGGTSLPHFNVGFGLLVFSVFMCGVVHFAMGSVYIGRGRRLIRGQRDRLRDRLSRGAYTTLAWSAGLIQLMCIVIGLILVAYNEPPAWLSDVLRYLPD